MNKLSANSVEAISSDATNIQDNIYSSRFVSENVGGSRGARTGGFFSLLFLLLLLLLPRNVRSLLVIAWKGSDCYAGYDEQRPLSFGPGRVLRKFG